MSDIKILPRKFKYEHMLLDDMDSSANPDEIMEMYAELYPALTQASVEGPEITDDAMVYTFVTKIGTKGSVKKEAEPDFELMDSIAYAASDSNDELPMLLPSEMLEAI